MLSEESKFPDLDGFRPPAGSARSTVSVHSGLTLLLGGARSGKSDLAVETARKWSGPVVFVATAEARDDDMSQRILAHKLDRPESWDLLEAPQCNTKDITELDGSALVIVDCLTLLVSNLLLDGLSEREVVNHVDELAAEFTSRHPPTLMISNEVGLGVHPATKLGSQYRDALGRVNRAVARRASTVALVIAGRVLPLADLELQITLDPSQVNVHTPEEKDGHF